MRSFENFSKGETATRGERVAASKHVARRLTYVQHA